MVQRPCSQYASVTAARSMKGASAALIRSQSKGSISSVCRRAFTESRNVSPRGSRGDNNADASAGVGRSNKCGPSQSGSGDDGSSSDSDDDDNSDSANDADSERPSSDFTVEDDSGRGVDGSEAGDGGRARGGVDTVEKTAAVPSQWDETEDCGDGDGEDPQVLPVRGEATGGRFSRFGPGREMEEFDPIREEALEGMYPSFEPSLQEILDDSHLPVLKDPFAQKGRLYR